MRSPVKLYSVVGSIGVDDITVHVMLDRKNNSIHIHFYGKMFSAARKPILVKHSNERFPEDDGVDTVKQIITGEFANKEVQIKSVTTENVTGADQTTPGQRTIIRFKE